MKQDRPLFKSDLNELKEWMEKRFDKQDSLIEKIEKKVDEERDTNIQQEVRLNVVEGKLSALVKWIGGIVASVFLMAIGMIFELMGRVQ